MELARYKPMFPFHRSNLLTRLPVSPKFLTVKLWGRMTCTWHVPKYSKIFGRKRLRGSIPGVVWVVIK
jgi:hypothetical protein